MKSCKTLIRSVLPILALGAAFASPAIAQISIIDALFSPEVRQVCPQSCSGFRTCRMNQYTYCTSMQNNCACRRVRGASIP